MRKIRLPTGVFEYDPKSPLGPSGGFGAVFAGRAPDGEPIAVKQLHVKARDAAHRELAIAAELQGKPFRNVVRLLDSGLDAESDDYFVVMEKAESSLAGYLDRYGPRPEAEAVEIALQIATGLNEVPNIVHRDLKPGNVLKFGDRWKIADFGIARFVEESTSTETLKGCLSPAFAAPEQWRGERSSDRTDIYALGCILVTLLNGKPPYVGDREAQKRQHCSAPVPSVSCSDSRIVSFIALALRKSPDARPSVARALTVLRGILQGPLLERSSSQILATVGAAIATESQRTEAARLEAEARRAAREDLHREAQQLLGEIFRTLWPKIHAAAPVAVDHGERFNPYAITFSLGEASLQIGRIVGQMIQEGVFQHSRWDAVSSSTLTVRSGGTGPTWETSLWFVKLPGTQDYRWYEVGYFHLFAGPSGILSANGYREADIAASRVNSTVQIAWGPAAIDGEDENGFHERCLWLLAKAAAGELRIPSPLPIKSWPPSM